MISISDIALEKCRILMGDVEETLSEHGGLRLKVEGGGCSGFQYVLSFDEWNDNDMVFWTEEQGEKFPVIVDKRSFLYVAGSQVNYTDGLMGSGFTVENPKANSTCGCGESFSV
ncbi:iron-sulfur cluster assembly accessory protein [archaeon]|nr:iron-sulfur cluster assembly accessory protein [archaeon]MAH44085.1 iron-sulfur cluster assembly accessory protein [archaeon]|tara:strand:+ start:8264 stop:8605 length:342 start_codon:yes stop_codon:yes gene_type:complete